VSRRCGFFGSSKRIAPGVLQGVIEQLNQSPLYALPSNLAELTPAKPNSPIKGAASHKNGRSICRADFLSASFGGISL
jgi:hypothetical protein